MRTAFLLPTLCLGLSAQTPVVSTAGDQRSVSLTLYQGQLSLVRETRAFKAPEGPFRLRIEGLPREAIAETLMVEARRDPSRLAFSSRSFLSGYPDLQKVLDRFIGEKVKVASMREGGESLEEGVLVTTAPQLMVQFPDRVEAILGASNRRVILPGLPSGFTIKPLFEMLGAATSPGELDLAVDYLCRGLRWHCDYSGTLDRDDSTLDLKAWATLINQTDTRFASGSIQLFSGEIPSAGIDQVDREGDISYFTGRTRWMALSAPAPPIETGSTGGHTIDTLPSPITLLPNQTVQVSLLASHRVPVRKAYVVTWINPGDEENDETGGRQMPVEMVLETLNDKAHELGRPLPAGSIKLFQPDEKGLHQFIGAPAFPETPTDQKLRLALGESPELTARGRLLNEKVTPLLNTKLSIREVSQELVLTNRQAQGQTVRVLIPVPGEWHVLQSSRPWKKESAHVLAFEVPVPARGKASLTFQLRVKS